MTNERKVPGLMRALRIPGIVVIGVIVFVFAIAMLAYPPVYVFRVMVRQESDAFDWQKFPSHSLNAARQPITSMWRQTRGLKNYSNNCLALTIGIAF